MKRILTIQDISCVGKCSLTVALPIISACGVECGVLPTAVLSTHTAFPKYTFRDLTDEIVPICDIFRTLGIDFDAVYTGYLGSLEQVSLVEKFFTEFGHKNMIKIIDPVMADNGVLYRGFTLDFVRAMTGLCAKADLIVPNLTEASFMLGMDYPAGGYDESYVKDVLRRLCALGAKCAILTGIGFSSGEIGAYGYDSEKDEFFYRCNRRLDVNFHGTGDIFASVLTGALMRGKSVADAAGAAVEYTLACIEKTMADPGARAYGVNFEEALPLLEGILRA